ncbi:MAG: DUF6175 family protein [Alistipes sp.]|jgi:hypothetical protein|nr:DUF6175 family protein [Alistipes sp.]
MKKTTLFALALLVAASAFGQAKKPTLMVVPSDNWCSQNGYMMEFDNMGSTTRIPDYTLAIQDDPDLINVVSKINILMADRGFPLKDLDAETKNLARSRAEASMMTSRSTGGEVSVSPIQQLRDQARADIIMQITWKVNVTGPKRSITYNLQGLDSYTNKQVAGAQGTGAQSFSAEVPVLLEEAVMAHMDNFSDQLQRHFDDLLTNGREISISLRMFDTSDVDFETSYGDEELLDIIDNWMEANTVEGRYSLSDSSYDYMDFEQVRIPVYNERGQAMDANRFARELRSFLSRAPYNIPCRVENQGLGQAMIILGEK